MHVLHVKYLSYVYNLVCCLTQRLNFIHDSTVGLFYICIWLSGLTMNVCVLNTRVTILTG